jgi:hypothetical protein
MTVRIILPASGAARYLRRQATTTLTERQQLDRGWRILAAARTRHDSAVAFPPSSASPPSPPSSGVLPCFLSFRSRRRKIRQLYTRQPDGPLTKARVPTGDLAPLWKSRSSTTFQEVLVAATRGYQLRRLRRRLSVRREAIQRPGGKGQAHRPSADGTAGARHLANGVAPLRKSKTYFAAGPMQYRCCVVRINRQPWATAGDA